MNSRWMKTGKTLIKSLLEFQHLPSSSPAKLDGYLQSQWPLFKFLKFLLKVRFVG